MSGKDPMGLAASALYLANTLIEEETHVTQRDVAEAAGVTEVTIRNRSKDMLRIMGELGLSGQMYRDRQHHRGRLVMTVAPIGR